MDKTEFFPATYKSEKQGSKRIFFPEVEKFDISDSYVNLLGEIAMILGKDPGKVSVHNMYKILESNKYLSK